MDHFYGFIQEPDQKSPFYERTFGTLRAARRWASNRRGRFVTINSLPLKYFY